MTLADGGDKRPISGTGVTVGQHLGPVRAITSRDWASPLLRPAAGAQPFGGARTGSLS